MPGLVRLNVSDSAHDEATAGTAETSRTRIFKAAYDRAYEANGGDDADAAAQGFEALRVYDSEKRPVPGTAELTNAHEADQQDVVSPRDQAYLDAYTAALEERGVVGLDGLANMGREDEAYATAAGLRAWEEYDRSQEPVQDTVEQVGAAELGADQQTSGRHPSVEYFVSGRAMRQEKRNRMLGVAARKNSIINPLLKLEPSKANWTGSGRLLGQRIQSCPTMLMTKLLVSPR